MCGQTGAVTRRFSRLPRSLQWSIGVVAIVLGALAVISGEADDSPGLQGLGCILIGATVLLLYRTRGTRGSTA